ncbi:MAG: aminoacetone oxidase family FAD-binding enzyme [Clostridiales bacterium]|nr:aminoacetone oxidase family FAD-binding enzyme [Clostridiales bacterium]
MSRKILAIIGGGASGMAAAAEASDYADNDTEIIIYERLPTVGKKLLATGNGRCNIMNKNADIKMYSGDTGQAEAVFKNYTPRDNIEFFEKMGLRFSEEEDGRLYPMSFRAASVLDALRFELANRNIRTVTGCKIEKIEKDKEGFILNGSEKANAVIVAGGGKSAKVQGSDGSCFELLKSLGVKINPTFPSLTGIVIKKKNKALKGIRAKGEILIVDSGRVKASAKGELQYTDYGISGIPAMNVSRAVSEHFALHKKGQILMAVNCMPDFSAEEIFDYIIQRKKSNPSLKCEDLLSGVMPKQLGIAKIEKAGINRSSPLSSVTKSSAAALTEILNSDIFEISGVLGFDHSKVTAGGADLSFFDNETLEAKKLPGLFACGEVLNIDGICGGYNLGWAWSSGRAAGKAAALYLARR